MMGKGLSKQPTEVSSLQFQTAQKGGVIPIVWGATRVAANLVDYDDFRKIGSGGGKGKGGLAGGGGKGGKGGAGKTTYSASGIFAICQGPIENTGIVWWNQSYGGLSGGGGIGLLGAVVTLYSGADGEAPDPTYSSAHSAKALGYSGTATVVANNLPLGESPVLPNFTFEVISVDAHCDAPNAMDCNPATIVADFLTNLRYGAGFPAANLDDLTDYRTYCDAAGIWLSPQLDQAKEAQQSLADITVLTNSAIVWSGNKLKILPYGDIDISVSHTLVALSGSVATDAVLSLTFTAAGLPGSPRTVNYTVKKEDVNFLMLAQRGLAKAVNADGQLTGFGITAVTGGNEMLIRQDPAGSVVVSGGGGPTFTIYATTTVDFEPDVTPIYDLTEDDFIVSTSGAGGGGLSSGGSALRGGGGAAVGADDDPVKIERTSPADADNVIQVEYLDRTNMYNTEVAEQSDQGAIDLYSYRKNSPISAHAICDGSIAQRVAQLGLNRSQLYRRTYTFRLGWKYCLLEPMDLVRITEPSIGVSALVVRITGVEEDDEGTLTITAEDFIPGSSRPVTYPRQEPVGPTPNYEIDPGNVNEPLIFAPPAALANVPQVWIGASGGVDWGGANVYVSLDDISYTPLGELTGSVRQGDLTATLPFSAVINPDNVNTLSVDLTESRGELTSVSAENAAAFATLCWVDGELLGYETATLTGPYAYNLTGLYRGAFGSEVTSHAIGSRFARLDESVGRFDLPPNLIGRTLYFKLQSYNLYGGGAQDLAGLTAWPFLFGPDSDPLWLELADFSVTDLGHITDTLETTSDLGHVTDTTIDEIDFGVI